MKRNIAKAAIGTIALITTVSCTTTANAKGSVEKSGRVEEASFIKKTIRVYEKYNRSIPAIIHDLKQCAPVQEPSEGAASYSAQ